MVSELRGVLAAPLLSESSQGQRHRCSRAGLEDGDQGAGVLSQVVWQAAVEAAPYSDLCGCSPRSALPASGRQPPWETPAFVRAGGGGGGKFNSAGPCSFANFVPSWPDEDITPTQGDVWPPQRHTEMPRWPPPPWGLAQHGLLCGGLGVLLGLCPCARPREECSRLIKLQGASGMGQSKPLLLQTAKRRCQWQGRGTWPEVTQCASPSGEGTSFWPWSGLSA